jgi:hypothetical protein
MLIGIRHSANAKSRNQHNVHRGGSALKTSKRIKVKGSTVIPISVDVGW